MIDVLPLAAVKPSFFAAALAVFALAWWRRRHLEPPLLIGLVLLGVGSAVYGSGLVEFPDIETALEDLGRTLGRWTYLVVGVLAFLETGAFVGLLAPGETAIMVGGLVAGQGEIQLVTLIGIVWVAAVCGDVTSFYIGRRLGREFLVKHGPRFQITEPRLLQVEAFFERHGGKAVLIGRFVGIIRAIAPFLAGSSGMSVRRFLPYDIIGAGIWGTTFCVLGYVFWQSFDQLVNVAKQGAFALGTTITVIVGLVVVVRFLRVDENRERMKALILAQEDKRLLRPFIRSGRAVYRRIRRPLRFAWDRITPGQLGLELTTLLAVLSVGSFMVAGPLVTLRDEFYVAGDRSAFDAIERIRRDWLDELAEVVTALGSISVAGGVVVLVALVLLVRQPRLDGVVLLAGMGLTWVVVNVIKDAEERGRPFGALVEADGFSYPSGHAAYGVAYVAVAVAAARALPGIFSRAGVVVAAIVLAAAIAASRVYLRVHYLSDVSGGIGVGLVCFSLAGMIGLVVAFVRNNGSPTAPPDEPDPRAAPVEAAPPAPSSS